MNWTFFAALWVGGLVRCAPAGADPEVSRGIVFNPVKTVLLAERYDTIEFLVPYPAFRVGLADELEQAASALTTLWDLPTFDCDLTGTEQDKDMHTSQLLETTRQEIFLAQKNTDELADEVAALLGTRTDEAPVRHRRFAGVIAATAIGTAVLGVGIGVATEAVCFLSGIFGGCHSKAIKANKRDIQRAYNEIYLQEQRWAKLRDGLNNKFYLVAKETEALEMFQRELLDRQTAQWNATSTALAQLSNNTKMLRECDEFLFIRSQANHIRTTVLAVIDNIYTGAKSYRVALLTYRINLLNSLTALSHGRIPMSLISRPDLEGILTDVATEQLRSTERLSLAIPLANITAYYETELVRSVRSTAAGLQVTLAVPLTSRELVMDVFEGLTLPMPNPDGVTATRWQPEGRYLAVSRTHQESAVLTDRHLESCVGNGAFAVCKQSFSVSRGQGTCLATLFYHDESVGVKICQISTEHLPLREQAFNLGNGHWLITSRSADFTLRETSSNSTRRDVRSRPGCRACVITLGCGSELESPNLLIKADRASCAQVQARSVNVTLASPVDELFRMLNNSHDFPDLDHHRVAREDLYRAVQIELTRTPSRAAVDSARLRAIAAPLVTKLTLAARMHTSGPSVAVDMAQACVTGAVACAVSLLLQALFRCVAAACRLRRSRADLPKGAASFLAVQAPPVLPISLKDPAVTPTPHVVFQTRTSPVTVKFHTPPPSSDRLQAQADLAALLAKHQASAQVSPLILPTTGEQLV